MASFETTALSKLLHGEVELIADIHKQYFSGNNQKLYTLIIEYYGENLALPSADALKSLINVRAPVTVRGGFSALVDAAMKADISTSSDIVIKSLKEAFVLRNVDIQMEELIGAQRNKDAQKVKGILSGLLEDISIQKVKISSFIDAIEEDDHFAVTPSGLGEEYDELLGGGFSGLTIVTAGSGGGKSILLGQCAVESYKEGKNVLYLSLELSNKVLGNRTKSYTSGVNFGKINTNKTTEEEKQLIEDAMGDVFKETNTNVWRTTDNPIDVDELLNIIKVEHQLYNIDVVVIDYLALVSPAKSDRGESYTATMMLVRALHTMTKELGIVIVTASQVNEVSKAKDGMIPVIKTRGSQELEFSATQLLYIDRTESDDPDTQPLSVYMIKNRLAAPVHAVLEGDFRVMKMVDTGIRLN